MKLSKITQVMMYPLMTVVLIAPLGTQAYDKGDWVLRAGTTTVTPNEDSSNVFVGGTDLGLGVSVENSTQLGLNVAYFFTPRWSLEVLAATPFSHDIELADVKLINAKQLPPSLTANYFFNDPNAVFQPYVGVGLNYTIFFDEGFAQPSRDAGFSNVDLDSSFGITAQVGFDFKIDKNWLFNASVRWIDIDTDATFDLNGNAGRVAVDIDPLVYTVSFGYRF
jgi:outer membrane protein